MTRSVQRTARTRPRSGCLPSRSEEHTSELQSQSNLVCRLLLEKKNNDVVLSGGASVPNMFLFGRSGSDNQFRREATEVVAGGHANSISSNDFGQNVFHTMCLRY